MYEYDRGRSLGHGENPSATLRNMRICSADANSMGPFGSAIRTDETSPLVFRNGVPGSLLAISVSSYDDPDPSTASISSGSAASCNRERTAGDSKSIHARFRPSG